jgi:hypothetical protein
MVEEKGVLNAADLLGTTLEPARVRRDGGGWRVPSLTVLFHLPGRESNLSRLEPRFIPPRGTRGQPLGDRHLSRTPKKLIAEGDRVRLVTAGNALWVDGAQLTTSQSWSHKQLERGVVIEMAERVVLLLNLLGPPAPPQPELGMVGESEALERIRADLQQVAQRQIPVLLRYESGTGKELGRY